MTERPDAAAPERLHPLTPVVQVWIWLVASAFFLVRQLVENGNLDDLGRLGGLPPFLIVFLAIGVVSLGLSTWSWWTTRFVVAPDELRIDHRGVTHESKRIAYQRIQSVDLTQPFAARLLGLAQLSIGVGADGPTKLQYLSRARATALRDELMARARGVAAPDAPVATTVLDDRGAHDRVLVRVPASELLLGAVLSHELLGILLTMSVPVVAGIAMGMPLLVGGGVLPILFGVGGFLSHRVIGQFNYTLAETPAGLRVTRGLTSLTSETMPADRIQMVRVAEPVLWRLIGRARVDLTFLGLGAISSDEDGRGPSSILLPIGRRDAVSTALAAVWPGLRLDAVALDPSPRRAAWLAPLSWRWMAVGADELVAVVRSGWWTRTTWIVPHARLQSVLGAQGVLSRRLGLAWVTLHGAGLGGAPRALLGVDKARGFLYDEVRRAASARDAGLVAVAPAPLPIPDADPPPPDHAGGRPDAFSRTPTGEVRTG